MSDYNIKNYTERDGQVTHIGGKLVIEDGAEVEGLPGGDYELPVASENTLGGIKIGSGVSVDENNTLNIDWSKNAVTRKQIDVSGTTAKGNVTVTFQSGASRQGFRASITGTVGNEKYRVLYDRRVYLDPICNNEASYLVFFHGFYQLEGEPLKEVIVGIHVAYSGSDVVYVRDVGTT